MGLGFFFVMYTARYLGAEGFGVLSFALAFTGMFGVLMDVGLSTLTIRNVARDNSLVCKYLGNIAMMKIVMAIVVFGLIVMTINFLGYPEQTIKVVYIIAFSIIFNTFIVLFNSIFQAYEKMEYVSIGRILNSVLMLVGILIAIKQSFGIIEVASIYFIVTAIVLLYSFVICVWKFVLPKMEMDWEFWQYMIKEALPFGLTGIFTTIYFWIDSVMLSLMQSDEAVGWYNAAYRLVMMLLFIPLLFNTTLFPSMSRFHISSTKSLKFICKKYFKFLILISIPIGVATTLLADKIILLIFGAGYIQSIGVLQLLIWVLVFIFANAPITLLFTSTNMQNIITKITGISMVVNIILNLLLIPKFSYLGASAATLITEFMVMTLAFVYAYKSGYNIHKMQLVSIAYKVIIASLIMGLFIQSFKSLNLFFICTFIAIPVYIVSLYFIGGIDKDDIHFLMRKYKG